MSLSLSLALRARWCVSAELRAFWISIQVKQCKSYFFSILILGICSLGESFFYFGLKENGLERECVCASFFLGEQRALSTMPMDEAATTAFEKLTCRHAIKLSPAVQC